MKLLAFVALVLAMPLCHAQQAASPAPAPKTVSVNGTTLTYLQQGSGTPVVFIHGSFSDHRIWETQRQAISAHHQFIALTMRYFGTAPWSDDGQNYTQATQVADVAAFVRSLGAGAVHVVGRSHGASIALGLTIEHPALVRALFLNEPTARMAVTDPADQKVLAEESKGLAVVAAAVREGNNNEATKQFYEWVHAQPGGFDDALSAEIRAVNLDNARTVPLQLNPRSAIPTTCEQLGKIKVPVTIVKGELTRPFFRIIAEAVTRCIPGAQLITISGARHGAPSQNPVAFNEALLTFLGRH